MSPTLHGPWWLLGGAFNLETCRSESFPSLPPSCTRQLSSFLSPFLTPSLSLHFYPSLPLSVSIPPPSSLPPSLPPSQAIRLLEETRLKNEEEERKWKVVLLRVYLNLSLCFLKQGKSAPAITYSRKALDINPKNVKAHFRLGQVG